MNTSISLLALAPGILWRCAEAQNRLPRCLSDTLGGVAARRLVPAAFVVPLALGRFELLGLNFNLYDRAFGLAHAGDRQHPDLQPVDLVVRGAMRSSDLRRRITEDVLRESGERNCAILEQAAEGIYLVDLESKRVIDSNAAMEQLLGYARRTHTRAGV